MAQPAHQTGGRASDAPDRASEFQHWNDQVKQSFISAGIALMNIRDGRLYDTAGYTSFAEYCKAEIDISESYASKWISAAQAARQVALETAQDVPNIAVGYALHAIDPGRRADVLVKAAEFAVSEGQPTITTSHVKRADAVLLKSIPPAVHQVARRLNITDSEKLMILTRWHRDKSDDGHSKWDAVSASGVLDPGDEKPPVVFSQATVMEIGTLEKRWQATRASLNNRTDYIIGKLSEAPIVDGQPVWRFAGKKVKIIIQEDSDE